MPDNLELREVKREASDVSVMGGLIVGAVSGVLVWTLIALLISAFV